MISVRWLGVLGFLTVAVALAECRSRGSVTAGDGVSDEVVLADLYRAGEERGPE